MHGNQLVLQSCNETLQQSVYVEACKSLKLNPCTLHSYAVSNTYHSILMSPSTAVQDCGCLLDVTNGMVVLSPNTLQNSVASYTCDAGHLLIGDSTRTCSSGTWSGSEPTCRKSALHTYLWWEFGMREYLLKIVHKYIYGGRIIIFAFTLHFIPPSRVHTHMHTHTHAISST